MLLLFCIATALLTFAQATASRAGGQDDYPSQAIQLMVPSSKGGGADLSFRVLAQALEPILGQKIEILNKPADGGSAGLAELAAAKPDGYYLGGVWNGPLTASPVIRKLPYSLDSFTAVATTFISDYVLCAQKDFPANSSAGLIELVRGKPFTYTYGSEGRGGTGYFAAESLFDGLGLFLRAEGLDGSAAAVKAFAAHQIDFYFGTTPAIMALVHKGDAKCLLTLSHHRLDMLPDATPAEELGAPVIDITLWRLIIAPKGLPASRVTKLEMAIRKAMEAPVVKAFLAASGERPFINGSAFTGARLKNELETFTSLVDRLGLKPE